MSTKNELDELNLALTVLRSFADEQGIVKGSVADILKKASTPFTDRRIKQIVRDLTRLGWRESIWLEGAQGSKVRLTPQKITDLRVLKDVDTKRKQKELIGKKAAAWFNNNRHLIIGQQWIITYGGNQAYTVKFTTMQQCSYTSDATRICLAIYSCPRPKWFDNLLLKHSYMGIETLYKLWNNNQAKPFNDQSFVRRL